MHKLSVVSGLIVAGAVAAACSGGTPAASSGPTTPPINIPSIAIPSIEIPTLPTGSFEIPSFAIPSFDANADPALAARFPQTVAGQPVTDVKTYSFIAFFQAFGTDAETQAEVQAEVAALTGAGIDATTLAIGNGVATVNGTPVEVGAFHTPGADSGKLLSVWAQLAAIGNPDQAPPTVGQATVGGKNVTTFTDDTGSVSYAYVQGDVLWLVDTTDPAEAEAVFSALS